MSATSTSSTNSVKNRAGRLPVFFFLSADFFSYLARFFENRRPPLLHKFAVRMAERLPQIARHRLRILIAPCGSF